MAGSRSWYCLLDWPCLGWAVRGCCLKQRGRFHLTWYKSSRTKVVDCAKKCNNLPIVSFIFLNNNPWINQSRRTQFPSLPTNPFGQRHLPLFITRPGGHMHSPFVNSKPKGHRNELTHSPVYNTSPEIHLHCPFIYLNPAWQTHPFFARTLFCLHSHLEPTIIYPDEHEHFPLSSGSS